tara:strand:+ start:180 stop:1106 length:927 start_codon:yes stop_codon:yes gene_type:complete
MQHETKFNPWDLPQNDIDELKRCRVVLSMSGGKDSTACALLLERHGVPFERVFMDTGWEHPVSIAYIKEVLEPRFGPIKIIKNTKYKNGMVDLIRSKQMFPSRRIRFCTQELKIYPFQEWVKNQNEPIVSVVGIRRQESLARRSAERWSYDEHLDIDVFKPILDHSFDHIIEMHRDGKVPPNPLYLQGAERVGCFPCIYARKSEVDHAARSWPARIDLIESLEKELTENAKRRADNPDDVAARTFFQSRGVGPVTIRDVIEWSKTSHGGRQYKLFDLTAQDGCTRWGMCESPLADPDLIKIREKRNQP